MYICFGNCPDEELKLLIFETKFFKFSFNRSYCFYVFLLLLHCWLSDSKLYLFNCGLECK